MLFLRASRMIPGHEMFESFSLGLAGKGGGGFLGYSGLFSY